MKQKGWSFPHYLVLPTTRYVCIFLALSFFFQPKRFNPTRNKGVLQDWRLAYHINVFFFVLCSHLWSFYFGQPFRIIIIHSFIPFACIRHTVVAHTHHPRHFTGTTLLRRIISSSRIKSRMAASQPLSAAVQADLAVRGAQTFMPNQKHLFRRVICIEWSHLFALRIYFT